VIVPTNTFGATAVAVLRAGATPVLADTAPDLTVCEQDVLSKVSPSTRAVVTVHIGGLISPRTTVLAEACASAGIPVIEDAAHAAGSSLAGRKAGSFGLAAAYSFFSTKVMTSGEGGILVTNDDSVADTARLLRDHAKNPDGTMTVTGYNWRLTEIQAILARAQLRRLDAMIASRNAVAAAYDGALNNLDGVHTLPPPAGSVHNRYKYVVLLDQHDPQVVEQLLRARYGISAGGYVYRAPCHRQPAFAKFARGTYPGADRVCPSHICPPVYPDMPTADAAYIADALRQVLNG
jgi:perosamine synthetase